MIMGPRNVIMESWNVNRGPRKVNRGLWNVGMGQCNVVMDRGM